MKTFIALFLFLVSLSAIAQEMTCINRLLPLNRHSGLHMVTRDEWNDGKEAVDPENVQVVLKFLVNSKLLCRDGELQIRTVPVCGQTVADLPQSNTCFVFTNLGYFIVSRDNGRNVNFIFSRDKRFEN